MLNQAIINSELSRIHAEQQAALERLKKAGVKSLLEDAQKKVWGAGEIEVNTGVIDLDYQDWPGYRETKADPKWDTVNPYSYLRTLESKREALEKGDDPKMLAFGVNSQRFGGWAGVSLVIYYPDTVHSGVVSGMRLDYSRVGPDWEVMWESLTVGSYTDRLGERYQVDSKKTTAAFSGEEELKDKIAAHIKTDSERRVAGFHDIDDENLTSPLRHRIRGFGLAPMFFPMGIRTNDASSGETFLYSGFLEKQMEKVARECNNPYNTVTVRDSFFSIEKFKERQAKWRPEPKVASLPDQRLALLDIKLVTE